MLMRKIIFGSLLTTVLWMNIFAMQPGNVANTVGGIVPKSPSFMELERQHAAKQQELSNYGEQARRLVSLIKTLDNERELGGTLIQGFKHFCRERAHYASCLIAWNNSSHKELDCKCYDDEVRIINKASEQSFCNENGDGDLEVLFSRALSDLLTMRGLLTGSLLASSPTYRRPNRVLTEGSSKDEIEKVFKYVRVFAGTVINFINLSTPPPEGTDDV